ncbi:MAG TPA: hypothetical protein VN281_23240 [Verrucomicrobiae bacterium]|nr:hypothetical protein [Verrucomicrobiae bacterium]
MKQRDRGTGGGGLTTTSQPITPAIIVTDPILAHFFILYRHLLFGKFQKVLSGHF